jgi:hypothetical protein
MKLGKFEKVELRECWKTEDKDFTPWLANNENIEILSEAIGVTLEVQAVEQFVGPFRADILCVDADSFESDGKHYVLIENQLEITDHKHLGQLMTYAAGLDAVTIVWISSKFTEEHRAALDWLNRITDETFRFFGIEIELYRINDSLPAPRFNIVAKPNDWSKVVKRTASNQTISEIGLLRRDYWHALKDFVQKNGSSLRVKVWERTYSAGIYKFNKPNCGLSFYLPPKNNIIRVYFWILGADFREKFDKLKANCSVRLIEEFGDNLDWRNPDNITWAEIGVSRTADVSNKEDWLNQFQWLQTNAEKLANFFKPEIEKL